MAYNEEKLTKLKSLKQLAQKISEDFATKQQVAELSGRVDGLVTAGGEPNTLETVKVNGTALEITDKAVNIVVPTQVSALTNDSGFQTGEQVAAAVAAAAHLQRVIVADASSIDPAAEGAEQRIYMVPKANAVDGDKYDEYMVIDGAVERVGDWSVDLSGYVTKEEGKGLSSNDYTAAEKAKLAGLEVATDAEVAEMLAEVFDSEG